MEPMTIHVLAVRQFDGLARARARVIATDARIAIEVRFAVDPGTPRAALWRRARDEVLRYLDPA